MTEKRTDTEGRELFCGEYERQDGRYEYRYKTREGKRCAVYAYRLSDLRHEEARIAYREYLDVSGTIRCITLNDQYEIWISGKQRIRTNTRALYQLPKITTHSLRHTFANILCEDNVNIKVIQTLMGQSDIETTMNIYTKVNSDFQMQEYIEKVHGSDCLGH